VYTLKGLSFNGGISFIVKFVMMPMSSYTAGLTQKTTRLYS